jgi:hypothetical protein
MSFIVDPFFNVLLLVVELSPTEYAEYLFFTQSLVESSTDGRIFVVDEALSFANSVGFVAL